MKLLPKPVLQRLEAVAVRALLALFGALPADAASGLGGWLARTIGPRLKVSEVARRNLRACFPDWDEARIDATTKEVWDNLGRVAAEFPHIAWLAKHRLEVVGMEILHALRDDGQPGLFVGGHLGNWEIPGALACREGMPVTLVYRAANNPWVEDIYRRRRAAAGEGGQIAKGAEGARGIMTVLKAGGHVGMLVDQKMNDGITVPFFGRDAMTAPAVGRFAGKFRCPVVPLRVERLGGAHFRLTIGPPLVHDGALDLLMQTNRLLEDWIRQRPGQWLWLHKRWPE